MKMVGKLVAAAMLIAANASAWAAPLQVAPLQVAPRHDMPALAIAGGVTTLKICAGATCREGLGAWVTTLAIPNSSRNDDYDMQWTTTAKSVSSALWQVSTRPLAGADDRNGLVAEGNAGSPPTGRFHINFAAVERGGKFRMNTLQASGPLAAHTIAAPHYYVRVVPFAGTKPVNAISNSVDVTLLSTTPSQPNPLVQTESDSYTIQIVKFEAVKPQTLPWGCLTVTAVDPAAFKGPVGANLYATYKRFLDSGQPLCPKVYKGIGEKHWYESLWDFTSGGLSWVSNAYAGIKKLAVQSIVKAINVLPGKLCNSTCEKGLTMGLDAGLVALGVPPSLPNAEQLTNQGLDYLVSAAADQAGIPCGDDCRSAIRNGVKQMASDATQATVSSYCGNVELAHDNGAEPLCLPPGVRAVPAPGSSVQPAYVTLKITRKPDAPVLAGRPANRIAIGFAAVNASNASGRYVVAAATCVRDTQWFPCDPETIKVDKPLSGSLFVPIDAALPPLKNGESAQYTFFLKPAEYWLPGHKELLDRNGSYFRYNDWQILYRRADLTIKADVLCPRYVGASMGSCVNHPAVLIRRMPDI